MRVNDMAKNSLYQLPYDPRKNPNGVMTPPLTSNWQNPNPNATVTTTANQTVTHGAGAVEPYDFTGSPGYQFRYDEGLRAIENGLTGRGLGLSGRAVKEAERFGQNYAADEFNAEFARNATLAGLTPPSIGSMNALIGNFANNASNIAGMQGQIGANSAYNSANINNNMINSLFQAAGMYMPQQYYNPNYGPNAGYAADGYGPPAWGG
jgi:hypothetical protein